MKSLGKIVGHIPARSGSKRVPAKNLRYLNGKPMIAYAIECACECGILDDVYVNTDSETIGKLAAYHEVKHYRRSAELASDTASGDDFTADFMKSVAADTVVMISPVCPLVQAADVAASVEAFKKSDCDTLITCHETQMQTFCQGKAVNIDPDAPLAPTQHNPAVQILNWAVTIWDVQSFLKEYEARKSGYIGVRRLLHPIPSMRAIKISHEEDFRLAEAVMRATGAIQLENSTAPKYWQISDGAPWTK